MSLKSEMQLAVVRAASNNEEIFEADIFEEFCAGYIEKSELTSIDPFVKLFKVSRKELATIRLEMEVSSLLIQGTLYARTNVWHERAYNILKAIGDN